MSKRRGGGVEAPFGQCPKEGHFFMASLRQLFQSHYLFAADWLLMTFFFLKRTEKPQPAQYRVPAPSCCILCKLLYTATIHIGIPPLNSLQVLFDMGKKNIFKVVDHQASSAPPHGGQDIENSLTGARAEFKPRPQKGSNNQFTKSFFLHNARSQAYHGSSRMRKSPLDDAIDIPSKIWHHNTKVSFCQLFIEQKAHRHL